MASATGFDVKHPFRTAALDASIGRIARIQMSPWEGPECAPKQSFHFNPRNTFGAKQTLARRFVRLGAAAYIVVRLGQNVIGDRGGGARVTSFGH